MSGLVPQTVEIRLGVRDKKTSDKLAVPGTLTRAENVEMTTTGRYQRRTGTITDSTPTSACREVSALDSELLALTNNDLYSRIGGVWTTRGASSLRHLTTNLESVATATNQVCHDFVRAGGYDWHVWEDLSRSTVAGVTGIRRNGIRYSVRDTATGAYVVTDKLMDANGSWPSIWVVGSNVVFAYVTINAAFTTATLDCRRLNSSNPTGAPTASFNVDTLMPRGANSNWYYDCFVKDSATLTFAYHVNSAGSKLRVREWTVSTMVTGGVQTSAGLVEVGAVGFLAHNLSDSLYYISCAVSETAPYNWYQIRQPTSMAAMTVTTLTTFTSTGQLALYTTGYVDGSLTAHMFAEQERLDAVSQRGTTYVTRTSGGVVTTVKRVGRIGLASKPWTVSDGKRYMLIKWRSPDQPTYFVVDPAVFSEAPFARLLAGLADALETPSGTWLALERLGRLPTPQMVGDVASLPLMKVATNSSLNLSMLEAWRADVTPWVAGVSTPKVVAGSLMIPGGFPLSYDGSSVTEHGFHLSPEKPTIVMGGGGTGVLGAGVYRVAVMYAWTDANGRTVRSDLSTEASFTAAANDSATIRAQSLYMTAKRALTTGAFGGSSVVIEFYISSVNAGSSAPLKYRGELTSAITSTLDTLTVSYAQDLDTVLAGSAGGQEYTLNGAVISAAPTPPMRQIALWKNRLVGLLEENRSAFAYSKLITEGLGAEMNEDFTGVIDDDHGDLYALASHGERMLFFKRNAVYWMAGEGPDDAGNGSFSDPARIDGAPGCTNPRSIVSTDIGTFYQAPDNVIWLITPGLERIPLGDPCADFTSTVNAALLVPDRRQVRFYLASGASQDALVYDLQHRRWTTFAYDFSAQVSACLFGGVPHVMSLNGIIYHDDYGYYADDAFAYTATIELAWMSLGSLNGYMRTWAIHILGELLGAHTLRATLSADYGTGTVQRTIATSTIAGALGVNTHGFRVEARVPLSMQQNTALKLRLDDGAQLNASFGIDGFLLQCGFAPGRLPKLPTTHRMT